MALDRRLVYHFDWTLFMMTLGLAGVGLLSVLSASWGSTRHGLDPLVVRQLVWIGVGTALMTGAAFFDYRALATYAYPFYALTVGLLAAVMVAGHVTGGSRRWLNLGVLRLEPSEVAKLALVLKQPDLGTGIILVLVTATLVFAGGLNGRVLLVALLAGALAAPAGWHYLKPYQKQRLVSFLNPQSDPLGAGYHIIQSEIAIGAGGAWGKGFLKGTQARLNFLPEQTTDFIFSVFAEEFGFAGSMLLMALYVGLIARGLWIARHARDRFGQLLCVGLTAIVFWQVAINIGMASGVLPVVGIPLPLVSYGGSSLIAMMLAMGLLISINIRRYFF